MGATSGPVGTQGASNSLVRALTASKMAQEYHNLDGVLARPLTPKKVSPNNERSLHRRKPGKTAGDARGEEGRREKEDKRKDKEKRREERERGRKSRGEVLSKDEEAEAETDGDSPVRGAHEDRPRVFPVEGG